jgi:WD40 repeat protein
MIATGGDDLKIWDADSGKLLRIIEGGASCLAWTSDGKTLIAGGIEIRKINTATGPGEIDAALLTRHCHKSQGANDHL